ncbi:MAG: GspMb/PilO family protein [Planctomycetota bacterium]
MALNKRETTLAWGVGTIVLVLAVDLWVIEPYFAQRAKLIELRSKSESEGDALFQLHREEARLKAKWADRRTEGLASDPKDAAGQVLGALKDWAGESGVVIASVKPEYVESKKELREIAVQVSASGPNESMIKFLYKLQTARFPLRVTEMQLGSRNDSEDLALQLRLSTLYLTPEKKDADTKKDAGKKVAKE